MSEAISKYLDINDSKTRKIVFAMNEADGDGVLLSLTAKLYQIIVDKIDDIDFGDIPDTKGDITKLPSYEKIANCIDILHDILVQYKQDTSCVDTIQEALSNMIKLEDIWKKGYIINIEIIQVTYCEMVLAIINSLSYMISSTIEYIKTPNTDGFAITVDKIGAARTKDSLVYGCLVKFNTACKKHQIEGAFLPLIKAKVKGSVGLGIGIAGGAVAIAAIALNILPILRELAFFFYSLRVRISEYFDVQADLLDMNVANLELNNISTNDDKDKVIKRQKTIANYFRSISNKICIDVTAAEKQGTKLTNESNKKMKIDDVVDTVPDSASNVLF
jgi:hypothetical protein